MSMITWWVNNYIHVGTTNREIIRQLRERMTERAPQFFLFENREQRKATYREAIEQHDKNRQLYVDVMG